MKNAYSRYIDFIISKGPYNQRRNIYSDQIGIEIMHDLCEISGVFKQHAQAGDLCFFLNLPVAKDSKSVPIEIDLVIGKSKTPQTTLVDQPIHLPVNMVGSMKEARVVIEHKSILTAHRNRGNRSKELVAVRDVASKAHPDAVLVANVIVGTTLRYLNHEVIDRASKALKVLCRKLVGGLDFNTLMSHIGTDHPDLHEFLKDEEVAELLLSYNKANDPKKTLEHLTQKIQLRPDATTQFYDVLITQFCHIDNIGPPRLDDPPYFKSPDYSSYRYENAVKKIARLYDKRFS